MVLRPARMRSRAGVTVTDEAEPGIHREAAELIGLRVVADRFRDAGFDWRDAGTRCSMCLGMNPDIVLGLSVARRAR